MKLQVRKLGIVLGFAAAFVPKLGLGQSFNVDLDAFGGPPEAGNGAPSVSFGAAANQPGFWNRVRANHFGTTALFDLSGAASTLLYDAVLISGSGRAFNNPANTGDFSLLLNDVCDLSPNGILVFRGLASGTYNVYSYAVEPLPQIDPIEVFVDGALGTNPQFVNGPMPGNAFGLGITHSLHTVFVSDGTITIRMRSISSPTAPVNGFQVVLVPEPFGASILFLGLSWLAKARFRKLISQ